jgi:hypothetical protein
MESRQYATRALQAARIDRGRQVPHPLDCRGEKDVERLWAMGLVATCNVAGAGKWRPEYSETFRDCSTVIVVDNDDPGRRHSLDVAAAVEPVAQRVRWLELPGLEEHGDISDWLDDGGTVEKLQALVKVAPAPPRQERRETIFRREGPGYLFQPSEAPVMVRFSRLADARDETTAEVAVSRLDGRSIGNRRRINLLGASGIPPSLLKILEAAQLGVDSDMWPDIIGQGFEQVISAHRDGVVLELIEGELSRPDPPAWLCADLLMKDKLNCWLGAAGTGKSTLAKMLCVCVATGQSFLNHAVQGVTPIYLDWEDDREDFELVIHDVCRAMGIWPVPKFGWIKMRGKRPGDSLGRHRACHGAAQGQGYW